MGKALNGIAHSGDAARLQKLVDAGKGGIKLGGGTGRTIEETLKNTQNIKSNLTKGALGLGTTAAVTYGGVKAAGAGKDFFTGNVGGAAED